MSVLEAAFADYGAPKSLRISVVRPRSATADAVSGCGYFTSGDRVLWIGVES